MLLVESHRGSVLDPILFSIYINDLPTNLSNLIMLFADGTNVVQNRPTCNPPSTNAIALKL